MVVARGERKMNIRRRLERLVKPVSRLAGPREPRSGKSEDPTRIIDA